MLQILLVDDESYVIDDLEIAFPWSDYGIDKIHKAYSGMAALQIIDSQSIDIVITDIAMPGMNGLELIKQVRDRGRSIPCILLTGFAEFEYAREAIEQGVVEYLIKPLDQEKLAVCLTKTIRLIELQLEKAASYEQAMITFREHLPSLKDKLLNQLIQGTRFSTETLNDRLSGCQLAFRDGDHIFLVLVRLEEQFTRYSLNSLQLFEYAVTNIACELFEDSFDIWHCRDSYDYLVFLLRPKQEEVLPTTDFLNKLLKHRSLQLHHNVNEYLKGGISVILASPGKLQQDIRDMYEHATSALKKQVGKGSGYFLSLSEQPQAVFIRSLHVLYEPPALNHLLELGQWEAFEERLRQIEAAYSSLSEQTEEHLEEIRSLLMSAFHYIAHKNHSLLSDLVGQELVYSRMFRSVTQLIEWAEELCHTLRTRLEEQSLNEQNTVIQAIQVFVSTHLPTLSLQSIADHVGLHPVYVSKLFKQLKGISLSEYILGVKMDLAIYLLRHSSDKIYEISDKLGYSNSQYFIKVFRDKFDMTPQEYRELA
ncbi:response regulator [Paenibacillus sp. FSL H8-0537]|uniref:response regulator n=1 Tax=Paenibacillus sp. FSL H8-0537 TaxID=2921399 RepID=UPI003100EB40